MKYPPEIQEFLEAYNRLLLDSKGIINRGSDSESLRLKITAL